MRALRSCGSRSTARALLKDFGARSVCVPVARDEGQEHLHSLLVPDRVMAEILYEATKWLALEVARTYPDAHSVPRVSGWNGTNSAAPHGIGGGAGAVLRGGDVVISLVLLQLNGYNVENERTYILGEPTDTQAHAFRTMARAQDAGAQQFRVGSTPADIDGATQRVIEEAGFEGICRTPILPRQGIGEPRRFRHSDDFVVGERAGDALTSYPRDLESLTVRL